MYMYLISIRKKKKSLVPPELSHLTKVLILLLFKCFYINILFKSIPKGQF